MKAAILIGQSQRGSPDFRPLEGVDNDLSDMHGFLQHVAGYDIVHEARDRTKATILTMLQDTLTRLSPGDRLLVYFSGHGHSVGGQHVLLCRGARRKSLEFFHEAIPVEQIRRETDGLGLERSVIVDSCWDSLYVAGNKGGAVRLSAEQTKYLKDVGIAPIIPARNGAVGAFGVLCGCGQDQVAVEIPRLRRGLFTLALMNVMKAAAAAQRELRLTDELCEAVARQMRALGKANNLPIVPVPWKSGGGSAPVIVEGKAAPVRPKPVIVNPPLSAAAEVAPVAPAPARPAHTPTAVAPKAHQPRESTTRSRDGFAPPASPVPAAPVRPKPVIVNPPLRAAAEVVPVAPPPARPAHTPIAVAPKTHQPRESPARSPAGVAPPASPLTTGVQAAAARRRLVACVVLVLICVLGAGAATLAWNWATIRHAAFGPTPSPAHDPDASSAPSAPTPIPSAALTPEAPTLSAATAPSYLLITRLKPNYYRPSPGLPTTEDMKKWIVHFGVIRGIYVKQGSGQFDIDLALGDIGTKGNQFSADSIVSIMKYEIPINFQINGVNAMFVVTDDLDAEGNDQRKHGPKNDAMWDLHMTIVIGTVMKVRTVTQGAAPDVRINNPTDKLIADNSPVTTAVGKNLINTRLIGDYLKELNRVGGRHVDAAFSSLNGTTDDELTLDYIVCRESPGNSTEALKQLGILARQIDNTVNHFGDRNFEPPAGDRIIDDWPHKVHKDGDDGLNSRDRLVSPGRVSQADAQRVVARLYDAFGIHLDKQKEARDIVRMAITKAGSAAERTWAFAQYIDKSADAPTRQTFQKLRILRAEVLNLGLSDAEVQPSLDYWMTPLVDTTGKDSLWLSDVLAHITPDVEAQGK